MSAIPSNHWLSSPESGGDGLFLRCLGVSAVVGVVFLTVVMLAPLPRQILKLATADAPRVARIMFSTPPAVVHPPAPAPLGGTPGLRPGPVGSGPPEGTGPKGPLAAKLGPGTACRARAARSVSGLGTGGRPQARDAGGLAVERRDQRPQSPLAVSRPNRSNHTGRSSAALAARLVGGRRAACAGATGRRGSTPGVGGGAARWLLRARRLGRGGLARGRRGWRSTRVQAGPWRSGGGGGRRRRRRCQHRNGMGGGWRRPRWQRPPAGGGGGAGGGAATRGRPVCITIPRWPSSRNSWHQFSTATTQAQRNPVQARGVAGGEPAGEVTRRVIQNTMDSAALSKCALSQIRDWKFPAIAAGTTAFQVPFVFTPPN